MPPLTPGQPAPLSWRCPKHLAQINRAVVRSLDVHLWPGPALQHRPLPCLPHRASPARPARARGRPAQRSPGGMVAKPLASTTAPYPRCWPPAARICMPGNFWAVSLPPFQRWRPSWEGRLMWETAGVEAQPPWAWPLGWQPGSGLWGSALALLPGIRARPQLCDPGMPRHALGHAGSCHSFHR